MTSGVRDAVAGTPGLGLPSCGTAEPTLDDLCAKLGVLEQVAGGRRLLIADGEPVDAVVADAGDADVGRTALTYFEVLIALEAAGILGHLSSSTHAVVWDVMPRWGGLAHRLLTLVPGLEVVLVGDATHLTLAQAHLRCVHGAPPVAAVTFDALPGASLPAPDAVLGVCAFDELPRGTLQGVLAQAHDAGCRWAYSLHREPHDGRSARDVLAERFWPQDVPVLDATHLEFGPVAAPDPLRPPRRAPGAYRHVVGRRRLVPA